MSTVIRLIGYFGGTTLLTRQVIHDTFRPPHYFRLFIDQVYHIGVRSIPLIIIIAASTGMVMTLQFGDGLSKFGGTLYVPKIVSLSIVREMGPVFACLMMAARVGAGITSEIGSMVVTQQIDAIRALGTSPIKKIVIPRVLACLLVIPLLSILAIAIGIGGGIIIGSTDLGIDPAFFLQKVSETVQLSDYFSGVGKTVFFSVFISISACYYGLRVRGGTQGVGSATTKSVVTSSILIMIGDFFLTKAFLILEAWL